MNEREDGKRIQTDGTAWMFSDMHSLMSAAALFSFLHFGQMGLHKHVLIFQNSLKQIGLSLILIFAHFHNQFLSCVCIMCSVVMAAYCM